MTDPQFKILIWSLAITSVLLIAFLFYLSLVWREFTFVAEPLAVNGATSIAKSEEPAQQDEQAPLVIETIVTSYTLGRPEENDNTPCIGAYNINLCELAKQGIKICASNAYKKDTKLKVGEIECVVLDKMNLRYKDRVDVATLDYLEAKTFGKQILPIKIINN